jgi:hypothetical protein
MIAASRQAPAATRPQLFLGMVAFYAAMATSGFLIAVLIATHTPDQEERRASALEIGEPLPTSFGTLVVQDVKLLSGPADEDLGGGGHAAHGGVQGLTTDDQLQVIAALLLTNRLRVQVDLSSDAFRLVSDKSDNPFDPTGNTLATRTLQPGASLSFTVRFIVPRDAARLWLELREPAQPDPALVALGATDQATPQAHHH